MHRYCRKGLWSVLILLCLNMGFSSKALAFGITQKDFIPLNIRIMFDLQKDDTLIWDGTARITEGAIDRITGIGFEHDDKIYTQSKSWRCILTKNACGPCGKVVTSKGIMLNITSPLSATCVLATKAGNFCVPLYELSLGKTIERYNGRLQIGLAPREFLLSANNAQDDSPSMTEDQSGGIWTCWISHKKGKDRIIAKRYEQGKWSDEMEVSRKPGKYFRPVVTSDAKGGIWVVWSAYQDENWDLFARHFNGFRWTRIRRITKHPSNDINQKIATDSFGQIWLCWESYRNGNADILLKLFSNHQWSKEIQVTKHETHDRQPDLAIDYLGKVFITWTRYSNGMYQILLKDLSSANYVEKTVAISKKTLAHPSLACDQDKLWIAWDEMKNQSQEQIGPSDTKNFFYTRRRISIRCYRNGLLYEPASDMYKDFPFPLKQHAELPELIIDKNGKVWVFFHNYVNSLPHSVWRIYGVYYQGDQWSQPILFPHYTWKNLASVSSCCDTSGNIWMAWSSDNRDLGNSFLSDRDVYVGYLSSTDNGRRSVSLTPLNLQGSHSNEKVSSEDTKEIPYKVLFNGKEYQLVWGTLYQPNNVKGYAGLDGFITDIQRIIMDDICLDYLGIGSYTSYDNMAYTNWLAEKANGLLSELNQFITFTIPQGLQNQLYQSLHDMASEKESTFIGTFVRELSSESLKEAFNKKMVYVASKKILLDARIFGSPMGEPIETKEKIPKIDISVMGTDELYQIDIYRNDACIYSRYPTGRSVRFSFLDLKMPKGINYYSVHVVQKNGEEARTLKSTLNAI